MRYFIDAEFNGFGGALVAFAAVPEEPGAAPFYEAVECETPIGWVAANVLPVLQTSPKALREVARLSAISSPATEPVLIADWPEDVAFAASLLTDGRGGRLLSGPVRFELSSDGFSSERHSRVPHNAYYDAVALLEWVLSP